MVNQVTQLQKSINYSIMKLGNKDKQNQESLLLVPPFLMISIVRPQKSTMLLSGQFFN